MLWILTNWIEQYIRHFFSYADDSSAVDVLLTIAMKTRMCSAQRMSILRALSDKLIFALTKYTVGSSNSENDPGLVNRVTQVC